MPTIQGEFPDAAAAQQAVDLLMRAGVSKDRIRCWYIVPEGDRGSETTGGGAFRGAVVGGLLGGAPGLAAGTVVGGALDEAVVDQEPLPASSGVRVAVDTAPDGPDVTILLRDAGAVNVETLSG